MMALARLLFSFIASLLGISSLRLLPFSGEGAASIALRNRNLCPKKSRIYVPFRARVPLQVYSSSTASSNPSPLVLKDYAILAIVPIVWGSYSPLVKGLYSAAEVIAPPPLIFNLMSYFISTSALTVAKYLSSSSERNSENKASLSSIIPALQNENINGFS